MNNTIVLVLVSIIIGFAIDFAYSIRIRRAVNRETASLRAEIAGLNAQLMIDNVVSPERATKRRVEELEKQVDYWINRFTETRRENVWLEEELERCRNGRPEE